MERTAARRSRDEVRRCAVKKRPDSRQPGWRFLSVVAFSDDPRHGGRLSGEDSPSLGYLSWRSKTNSLANLSARQGDPKGEAQPSNGNSPAGETCNTAPSGATPEAETYPIGRHSKTIKGYPR
jgi:hypothetical protein